MRLPECSFYVFGMGDRRKLLYRGGELLDPLTGETVRRWEAKAERILPSEYRVEIETADGGAAVVEDEEGVWIEEAG